MRFDIDKIQFPSVSLHNNYYSLFVFRDTTQNKVDLVKKKSAVWFFASKYTREPWSVKT